MAYQRCIPDKPGSEPANTTHSALEGDQGEDQCAKIWQNTSLSSCYS